MKYDERAFRHNQKIALDQSKSDSENIEVAPIGNYYD
jgi:hypothetical protein